MAGSVDKDWAVVWIEGTALTVPSTAIHTYKHTQLLMEERRMLNDDFKYNLCLFHITFLLSVVSVLL